VKPATTLWAPFRHPAFRWLWLATVAANVGSWTYNAAAGWLMTSLDAHAVMVSLVQVAASLPMFLFALPAGALADIIDRRRFILFLEVMAAVASAIFAALVSLDLVHPVTLLLFMFLIGTIAALEAPAWQAIVPQLVPKEDLGAAISLNSVGVNISRAVGPALAGAIIAGIGIAAPFWIDTVSNFGVLAVLLWWKSSASLTRSLPAERVTGALRAGFRYARNNRHLRATLARSIGFFLPASAYWALLPLVARNQIGGGPQLYGLLLGAIGAGALAGAFALSRLKSKVSANRLVATGEIGTAVALILFGLAREPVIAVAASIVAGACWIAALSSLNVSAQLSLPDWVRGRGLAMYVTVFFGTMTVGSLLWGELAALAGLPPAHFAAAATAIFAALSGSRWKLQTGKGIDLTPSMHWPEPVVTKGIAHDAGPVMVTVEYRIDAKDRDRFLTAIDAIAAERRRDGAYAWGVFQNTADATRLIETFLVESWAEHLRQHRRVTNADHVLETVLRRYLSELPKVTHYVAAEAATELTDPQPGETDPAPNPKTGLE
jgi:predicted MFS family arabinose efflux permease